MIVNLIAEIVKLGVQPDKAPKLIAETIGCTAKTARNKLKGQTDFTVPEAVKINHEIFQDKHSIAYLFARVETKHNDKAS